MSPRIISIVLNTRAAAGGSPHLRTQIEAVLARPGVELRWYAPTRRAHIDRVCAEAAEAGDLVVAVGGDGTVRSVAQAARTAGTPMAIIPTGTYNYVARYHDIPEDIPEAARLAIEGGPLATGVGDLNGLLFFNHAAFGLYTRIIAARERHTAMLGRSRVTAVLSGIATLFNRYPIMRLHMDDNGVAREVKANAVFFGANPLMLAAVDTDFAERVRGHALGLVLMKHQSRLHVLGAALHAVVGRLSSAPAFELSAVSRMTLNIRRRRRRLRVSLDGEIIKCPLPLQLAFQQDALLLVRPEHP
jgi:diacylglycerol kinase family enzyme